MKDTKFYVCVCRCMCLCMCMEVCIDNKLVTQIGLPNKNFYLRPYSQSCKGVILNQTQSDKPKALAWKSFTITHELIC